MADTIEETMKQQGATVYENGQPQQDDQTGQGAPNQEEPRQEEPKGEPGQEPGQEPAQVDTEEDKKSWLNRFNEQFQTQYESEDQLKELFDYKTQHSDLQEKIRLKDEALSQASDPNSYFANESLMKVNEIVKQHNVDINTAAQLASTDFSQMGDDQVVLMNSLLENPEYRGDEDLLREEIQEQYGLDVDLDDYEGEERSKKERELRRRKKKMEVDARKARQKFQNMQQVELPQKQNLEEGIQQKEEQFAQSAEKNADKFISDMSKIEYGEGMEFQLDDEWKNNYLTKDNLKNFASQHKIDLSTEEGYEKAKEAYKMGYVYKNLPKILNDYKKRLQTEQKDEEYNKYNNPRPNNRGEKPDGEASPKSKEKVNQEIAADFGIKT
jgi:hypothetical protein